VTDVNTIRRLSVPAGGNAAAAVSSPRPPTAPTSTPMCRCCGTLGTAACCPTARAGLLWTRTTPSPRPLPSGSGGTNPSGWRPACC
jgi:phosphodiesterase/alkaline phosphatase D-like protein